MDLESEQLDLESSSLNSENDDVESNMLSPSSKVSAPVSAVVEDRLPRPQRSLGAELLPSLIAMIHQRPTADDEEEHENLEREDPALFHKRGLTSEELADNRVVKRARTELIRANCQNFGDEMEVEVAALAPTCSEHENSLSEPRRNTKSFTVLYAKPTTKKHKTWEGDGTLTVVENGKEMILRDDSNQILATSYNYKLPEGFGDGTQLQIGGKVIEVQEELMNTGKHVEANVHCGVGQNEKPSSSARSHQQASVPSFARSNKAQVTRKDLPVNVNTSTDSHQAQIASTSDSAELQPAQEINSGAEGRNSGTEVYNVLYAKPTTKKHKTWEGDGTLTIIDNGREMILRGEDEQIAASAYNFKLPEDFSEGSQIQVGGKVVEIQEKVTSGSVPFDAVTGSTHRNGLRGTNSQVPVRFNREFRQPAAVHFQQPTVDSSSARYSVLYAPPLTEVEKYPRWEGDGILAIVNKGDGKEATLADDNGTVLETVSNFQIPPGGFTEGVQLQIGGKYIEITRKLTD